MLASALHPSIVTKVEWVLPAIIFCNTYSNTPFHQSLCKIPPAACWLLFSCGAAHVAAAGSRLWCPRSPTPPHHPSLPSPNSLNIPRFGGAHFLALFFGTTSLIPPLCSDPPHPPLWKHTCLWRDRQREHLAGRWLPGECLTQGWHWHRHTNHYHTLALRRAQWHTGARSSEPAPRHTWNSCVPTGSHQCLSMIINVPSCI